MPLLPAISLSSCVVRFIIFICLAKIFFFSSSINKYDNNNNNNNNNNK